MDDEELIKKLVSIAHNYQVESKFLEKIRAILFQKETHNEVEKSLILVELHNRIEKIFDRILRYYIRPMKSKWQDIYNEDIRIGIKAKVNPEEVRKLMIFKYPFFEKKAIIIKLLPLSKETKGVLEALNNIRNGIVHKYVNEDERFNYKGKNVFQDRHIFVGLITDVSLATEEILKYDTALLDAIDKAESELA